MKKLKQVKSDTPVLDLLSQPGAWTKGTYARDATGTSCRPEADAAVSFCLVGAMRHCYPDIAKFLEARGKLHKVLQTEVITRWNDIIYRQLNDVLDVVRKAEI